MKDYKGGWMVFYIIWSFEECVEGQCIVVVYIVLKVFYFVLGIFIVWVVDGEEWFRFIMFNGVVSIIMSKVVWGVGRMGQGLSVGVQILVVMYVLVVIVVERV